MKQSFQLSKLAGHFICFGTGRGGGWGLPYLAESEVQVVHDKFPRFVFVIGGGRGGGGVNHWFEVQVAHERFSSFLSGGGGGTQHFPDTVTVLCFTVNLWSQLLVCNSHSFK